jgi:hypothetical protein
MLRRLPGWPHEHLHELLNKHNTEGFKAVCNGGDNMRRMSDEAMAKSSYGAWCGSCHCSVSDPWYSYMKQKITPHEVDVLETTTERLTSLYYNYITIDQD